MDQLREDTRERTWEDYIETAGAALAIGAGAAYFLRHGGARQLSNFGQYLSGAKQAIAENGFDDILENGLKKGHSAAYKLAMDMPEKHNLMEDPSLEAAFKGLNILRKGKERDNYIQRIRNDFKMSYGHSLLNEMLNSGTSQYIDENATIAIQNMLPSFLNSSGEELTELGIRLKLRNTLGDEVSEDVINDAAKFASEIQHKMRSAEVTDQLDNLGQNWLINVNSFKGFDPTTGQPQWDANTVVHTISQTRPEEEVNNLAKQAMSTITALERNQELRQQNGLLKDITDATLGKEVTLKEVLDAVENGELDPKMFASRSFRPDGKDEDVFQSTLESVKDLRKAYQTIGGFTQADVDRLDSIVLSGFRRDANGQIYSTAGLESLRKTQKDILGSTPIGKMLRTTEDLYNEQRPNFFVFDKGTSDFFLSQVLGGQDPNFRIPKRVVYMNGRFYENDANGIKEIKELRDYTIMSTEVGIGKKWLEDVRESARYEQGAASKNWKQKVKDSLDVEPEVKPLEEKYGNNFDWMFLAKESEYKARMAALNDKDGKYTQAGVEITQRVNRFLQHMDKYGTVQEELTAQHLTALKRAMGSELTTSAAESLDLAIQILQDPTNEKAIEYLSRIGTKDVAGTIQNNSLAHLIVDFKKDQGRTLRQTITHTDLAKTKAGSVHYVTDPLNTNLAKELVRESFMRLRLAEGEDHALDIINRGINNAFKNAPNYRQRYRTFTAVSFMDAVTKRDVYDQQAEEIATSVLEYFNDLRRPNTAGKQFLHDVYLKDFYERYNLKGTAFTKNESLGFDYTRKVKEKTNAWAVVHKNYEWRTQFGVAASIVANNNEGIFSKATFNAIREAAKPLTQYISGNDMFQAASIASAKGYRIFNLVDEQLNHEFDVFGAHFNLRFGLNDQDKGSAFKIYQNLLLKRVLPAAAIYTYLDFADDTARAITGMGIGEAGMSGLANVDLAVRKITGATGLDYVLKGMSSDSPFARYMAGYTGDINPEWQSYEERKDYYERGYTPIRKARYWKFGSSNEYRGGRISYFEPNTLRMMRSNYFMESMYEGSMWTKWSHSLLPTPLNPISPLFYYFDPYYLENLHKEDRPYPVTGSTFAENTLWGVMLNPIFDAFVKPRKRMHTDRLDESGIDVRALIAHINNNIQQRANNQQNNDIIYLQNGKLRSMLFTAFNAPTPSERVVGQQGTDVTVATEYGEYGTGIDPNEYPALAQANVAQMQANGNAPSPEEAYAGQGIPVTAEKLSVSDRMTISAGKGNAAASLLVTRMKESGVFDLLRGENMKIRQQGMLRKDQGFFYENKMQYERSSLEDLLSDSETIADLMTAGQGHDYVHEMAVSTRMVTGLYGYMASVAFGIGSNNQKQIATSANMESAGRSFWDLSVGGFGGGPLGGEIMEIARRFIPEYHRMQQVNPLMNTMPDWLPERMRFGDPYASLPKGEARLPGRGYESLNQLHPDIYGRYGAFDRFKILADVAPYSPEYKFWKKVAGATIQDPKLKQEMQEIKDRVAEQTKGHDFFDYKYVGRGMEQKNVIVSEVLNFGKFKIVGSEQVYKLSGVKISGNPNETTQQVMSRYILPGQEITMYTDSNPAYARNNDKDQTINAGVMIAGENVAEQMLEAGDAKKRKGDTSAPSYMLNHNAFVNTFNMLQEIVGHADIPIFHSRFMNMNSPLESYLDDNVYGTAFQNWSAPWATYIRPSLQIEASNPTWLSIGILSTIAHNTVEGKGRFGHDLIRKGLEAAGHTFTPSANRKQSLGRQAFRFLDRGSMIAGFAANIMTMGNTESLSTTIAAEEAGHVLGVAYAALNNPNNLAVSTIAWSRLGYLAANYMLRKEQDMAKVYKGLGKGTLVGAAIGLARWAAAKKMLASDDTANTYIPEATRKKWDMQEYFDRLTYVKYMGLYEQAADMAEKEEGVNIRQIIEAQAAERKELLDQKEKLRQDMRALDMRHDPEAEEAKKLARKHLSATVGTKLALRGGQYTKSAIMYKNVADATMYGLDEHAMMADIVRALPKTERDYFIEFMKEKDPEKREEILKTVSPLLNRALRTIWKMPLPEKVSNEEYFEHHTLPAPTWAGWRPDIDLANVAAKVIYNEGMQYSDMGIYASQYREPDVINAPNIEYNTSINSTLLTQLKLRMAMQGTMIDADTVSVEPSQDSGIQVITNLTRVVPYKIGEEINNLLSF